MKALSPKPPRTLAKLSLDASSPISLWRTRIENCDAQALWRALHRLVAVHPMVRATHGSQSFPLSSTPVHSLHDLTQDLYLVLLQKGRFNHYLTTQMSDGEIEREIFQIELTNLLVGNLRRHRPESYRLVRRISQLLESNQRFRQFKGGNKQSARHYQREAVFGLREWSNDKVAKDSGTFAQLITSVPSRRRNRRRAGCTGETQVIISNQELLELLVEILTAIGSPAPLRTLRQLALSKLPVCDPVINSLEDQVSEEQHGRSYHDAIALAEANPETIVLRDEEARWARHAATIFPSQLSRLTRYHPQRTERLWRVLWHCYFDPAEPSQLEIAEIVGISDSSISDYRRKIEAELRRLDFAPEHLHCFAEELAAQLRWRLSLPEQQTRRNDTESEICLPHYEYALPAMIGATTGLNSTPLY